MQPAGNRGAIRSKQESPQACLPLWVVGF